MESIREEGTGIAADNRKRCQRNLIRLHYKTYWVTLQTIAILEGPMVSLTFRLPSVLSGLGHVPPKALRREDLRRQTPFCPR